MNVLYVSKALVTSAYRDKLTALARHVEVRGVVPERWGENGVEPGAPDGARVDTWPALLHGHNHLHVYRRPGRLLDSPRPDLVHIDEEPYSAVTFQLVRQCRRRRVPCLFFSWQNLAKRLPPPFAALRAHVFEHAAGAIAGTEDAGAVLRYAGYRGRLAVIPQFGVDPDRFAPDPGARSRRRSQLGVTAGELLIGFGGRLVPEKGVHLLVEALARVEAGRLVLVGDGPYRAALERIARGRAVDGRVHFVGRRPSLEVPEWLAACDVVVLPSVGRRGWIEQFGRVMVEAMACGVPVVGSRCGEIPRVIGDAGRIVPANDAGALADVLRELAGSPPTRAELGRRARARVLEHFTHARIAADTAEFYREVAA